MTQWNPPGEGLFAGVVVRDLSVRRVLTSPALRCEQTAAPLAVDRVLPLRRCAVLGVEGSTESLLDLLGPRPGAWCTESDSA